MAHCLDTDYINQSTWIDYINPSTWISIVFPKRQKGEALNNVKYAREGPKKTPSSSTIKEDKTGNVNRIKKRHLQHNSVVSHRLEQKCDCRQSINTY